MGIRLAAASVLALAASASAKLQPLFSTRHSAVAAAKPRADVARFRARVDAALADGKARQASWGVIVVDQDTGETLFERDADSLFTPASNAKLFTTAFALATLGPDYHFRTTIETSAEPGPDGRLGGDVVLVGRGDPDLSNRKLPYDAKTERDGPAEKVSAELADAVVAKGVKQIDGDIVADDSYFAYDPYPEGWTVGDLYFEFGAPISAIAVDENTLTVEIHPGERLGDPAEMIVAPQAGYETFGHEVITGPSASKPKFSVVRQPGPHPILLRGSVPLGGAPAKLQLAIEEPAAYAAGVLKELLEARGVRISGIARAVHGPPPEREADGSTALDQPALEKAAKVPDPRTVLAEHVSAPLIESIRLLNKISHNLHAEMILRTIAREKAGIGTTDAGIALERDFLKSAGIAPGDTNLVDGSGLSRQNLVTPRATVEMLAYAARQPWGESFLSTLPIAGEDGTLEDRLKGTPAAGRLRAKTGSLEHVRSMSGVVTTLRGAHLLFAMYTNNNLQPARDATKVFDAVALAMVEEIEPHRKKK